MAFTLEQAQTHLQLWLDASAAVASGAQSYKIGSRSLTRANTSEILRMINYWRDQVDMLASGRGPGMRVMRVIPRDL